MAKKFILKKPILFQFSPELLLLGPTYKKIVHHKKMPIDCTVKKQMLNIFQEAELWTFKLTSLATRKIPIFE